MADKLAWSSDGKTGKETPGTGRSRSDGPARMRLEKKGRRGKSVTVVFDLPLDKEAGRRLQAELQQGLGCGGTFKEGRIELQGDRRDGVEKIFKQKGLKVVRAGG